MGLLDKFRAKAHVQSQPVPVTPSSPPLELDAAAVGAADECHRTGRDVGNMTRGKGSALLTTVAGTFYRQDAVRYVAGLSRAVREPEQRNLAAVVRREPTNAHDKNAVRVLVDGVHIGFLPKRDAQRWQSVLVECERRQVQLVGSVRLLGGENGDELAASIGLRDGLDGFEGTVTKQRLAAKARADADAVKKARQRADAVALLTGEACADVVNVLARLARQEPVRTKQNAGLVAKHVRDLLPALRGHADALAAAQPSGSSELLFVETLDNLESSVDDLLEAADADEREDLHDEIQDEISDLLSELAPSA